MGGEPRCNAEEWVWNPLEDSQNSASVSLGTGLPLPERSESKWWGGKFKCSALLISKEGVSKVQECGLLCVQCLQVHLGVSVGGGVGMGVFFRLSAPDYFEIILSVRDSLIQLDCLADIPLSQPQQHWFYRHMLLPLTFCVYAGDLNSDPHVKTASSSMTRMWSFQRSPRKLFV